MTDLLKIASEVATHAVESGAHAAAASNPVEALATGFHVEVEKLISQIVSILIIFGAFRLLAWKPILQILDERRRKISDGLQYAEEMKSKLAESERKQAELLKEAALEAKRIQTEAQNSARALAEKSQADAQRKAEELVTSTRESLGLERKQMLAELKEHAAKLVATTTAKVLQRELNDSEKSRFTESAVSELQK